MISNRPSVRTSDSPRAKRVEQPNTPGIISVRPKIRSKTVRFLLIVQFWSRRWDSNPLPAVYDTAALPGELLRRPRLLFVPGRISHVVARLDVQLNELGLF